MGQTLSTVVGYMIVFYLKFMESVKTMLSSNQKEKGYYNNDILLKDDEQQAGKEIFLIIRYSFK